jgi:CheY-like chemotaxis protein
MEAMGRLAGGIAHDFNNLLTVILAHASFMLEDLEDPEATKEYSTTITEAAERACALTQQLLAFSRRQPIQARVVDAAQALAKAEKLLRRTIPSSIEVEVRLDADLWPVLIDPGRFDQLSMNLALNAVDAMPEGGRLTMQVQNRIVNEPTGLLPAGDYVALSVCDTGVGIAEPDLTHVFEPFFTTKREGKGSGLGLATCYSIAREAKGDVQVSSNLGKGSVFEVLLPRCQEADHGAQSVPHPRSAVLSGHETILVVEDEPAVLSTITRMLERHGYTVVQAANGVAALHILETTSVALVLTDTVMPHMGGLDLAGHLASSHPSLRVLFMTGYADENSLKSEQLPPASEIMLKPFATEDLIRKVREVLDEENDGS